VYYLIYLVTKLNYIPKDKT